MHSLPVAIAIYSLQATPSQSMTCLLNDLQMCMMVRGPDLSFVVTNIPLLSSTIKTGSIIFECLSSSCLLSVTEDKNEALHEGHLYKFCFSFSSVLFRLTAHDPTKTNQHINKTINDIYY